MNKKETTVSLAIVSMALLATITTLISPNQALALGHWNLDKDFTPNRDVAGDGMDSSGTSDNTEEDSKDEEYTTAAATTVEDEDEEEGSEESNDSSDDKDSSSSGYEAFQDCLAELGESPTEQEVQDCIDSAYSEIDSSENTPRSTDDGEKENSVTEHVSTDDTEVDEDEEDEELE